LASSLEAKLLLHVRRIHGIPVFSELPFSTRKISIVLMVIEPSVLLVFLLLHTEAVLDCAVFLLTVLMSVVAVSTTARAVNPCPGTDVVSFILFILLLVNFT
jgi:hypothetical protein